MPVLVGKDNLLGSIIIYNMIVFTSKPAIMVKGMAFNEVETKNLFFADELKYRM